MSVNYVAFYENGVLIKTEPELKDYYNERDKFQNARFIISDGIKYDLENADSISNLKIPNFKEATPPKLNGQYSLDLLGFLDCSLRMKASQLRNRHMNELSVCLLIKVNEMMKYSSIHWTKKDYIRLVNWLYEDGKYNEADRFEKEINKHFSVNNNDLCFGNPVYANNLKRVINSAKSLGEDLLISNSFNGCCSECAKYRKRIYSISGEDKRFPKVPKYKCTCQGIVLSIFIEGISNPNFPNNDYVSYSNRPFMDDRTDEEKRNHLHYLDRQVYERIAREDFKKYHRIKAIMPESVPKSFNAFRRLKNSNSDKFKTLASEALKYDIDISMSEDEEIIVKRYLARVKETGWK